MLRIKLKCLIILPDYNQICTPEIYVEVPNIKFNVKSDIVSRAGTCGQTQGQTDGHDEGHRRFPDCTNAPVNIRTYEAG
jgi:hypothetical protein